MTRHKYMSHIAEIYFVKRSDQQSLKKVMRGNLVNVLMLSSSTGTIRSVEGNLNSLRRRKTFYTT